MISERDSKDYITDNTANNNNDPVSRGFLLKRKDFIGVDQEAHSHPNRFYYYKNFDVEEIIDTCSKKLQSDPNDEKALFLRGSSLFKKRQYYDAIDDFNEVLLLDPTHVECLYTRGMSYSRIGEQDQAILDFTSVLDISSDHVNAAFARAACYNSLGQFSRAIENYNFALSMDIRSKDKRRLKGYSVDTGDQSPNGSNSGSGPNTNDSPSFSRTLRKSVSWSLKNESDSPVSTISRDTYFEPGVTASASSPVLSTFPVTTNITDDSNLFVKTGDSPVSEKKRLSFSISDTRKSENVETNEIAEQFHNKGYEMRKLGDFKGAVEQYTLGI